jgi:glutaredoxin 3
VSKRIVVYTADPCARCRNAKALLESRGYAFTEVNLTKDPDGRAELARKTGLMTFPQIVVEGETIGGFDDLKRIADDGRLDDILTPA